MAYRKRCYQRGVRSNQCIHTWMLTDAIRLKDQDRFELADNYSVIMMSVLHPQGTTELGALFEMVAHTGVMCDLPPEYTGSVELEGVNVAPHSTRRTIMYCGIAVQTVDEGAEQETPVSTRCTTLTCKMVENRRKLFACEVTVAGCIW